MEICRDRKRQAATLIFLLIINLAFSAFLPYPLTASAHGKEKGGRVPTATPSSATPSDASRQIVFIDVPDLVVLEVGEADEGTWRKVLPRQAIARTGTGEELFCNLEWFVSHADWDQPGGYHARIDIIPPDGYRLYGPEESSDAVISIHPPGTSQVMEVFTYMRYGMKGHTWTFAMKAGQDMTPLVEVLEQMTVFNGILDEPAANISFSVEWDFSSVDPGRPGIYPIYRSLTLMEDSLPEGVSPEKIYVPDYWEKLPVLFSVEEPGGGPQLYGVLESPFLFFGSYAKLSEEELESLKVWYSIDEGEWTLQTDEGLMETYETNFFINKDVMAEGCSYSFRLELGDFVSRDLTVQKNGMSPVWFTCMMEGNRDGTIEVEFPSVSQPPPTDPPEETDPPSTDRPEEEEPPPADPPGKEEPPSADGPEETNPPSSDLPGEEEPPSTDGPQETNPPSSALSQEAGLPSRDGPEEYPATETEEGPDFPVPEEVVTRWSTQISGIRCRKLVELYPNWILFQKEEVSVYLSSQWLRDQQMRDSDVLTVSVSPGEDHAVTILINQKEPLTPPVFQVMIKEKEEDQSTGVSAAAVLFLLGAGVMAALFRRRWKK